ncbi:MAG: hypothetical protein ACK4IA_16395 [Paracoccus hibiscisoli]|uniref:hypothetical protein n=1 Tax=Paracoccus hibiscisoli TaxID=2023261 RepID=UPI00391B3CDE
MTTERLTDEALTKAEKLARAMDQVIRCARVDAGCNPTGPEWLRPYLFSIQEDAQA